MRSWSRIGRGFLPAALVLLVFSPLAGIEPDPFNTHRVLGDDGSIFEWSSGGSLLRPAASPLGFTDLAGSIADLATFAGGTRLLVLTPNRNDPGKGRKRREGLAIVYDTSQPIPVVIHQIPLLGDGYGVVAASDGRRCYVLAARLGEDRGGPRFWIHGLDPETGEVIDTTLLERPGSGLAVAPDGARLFVSFESRIQSYTTRPLLTSWHYRSPGINGQLYFPPAGDTLYAVRTGGIALFDPEVILNRDRSIPSDETDDSTGIILLPFGPSAMLFSSQRQRAAALGAGTVAFIDLATGEASPSPGEPAVLREASLLRPLEFLPGGDLVVALFPDGLATTIPAPPVPPLTSPAATPDVPMAAMALVAAGDPFGDGNGSPPPEPDGVVDGPAEMTPEAHDAGDGEPGTDDDGISQAAVVEPAALAATTTAAAEAAGPPGADLPPTLDPPTPRPLAAPIVAAPATPAIPDQDEAPQAVPEPSPGSATGFYLSGRLDGEMTLVTALVLYGPGSIIREHARVAPSADGRFSFPLPPPGTYRLVPVGGASRPIAANPNFHTITVQAAGDRTDLDFSIELGQ